ncbi:MAG: TRAP transporter substrate-binding protein [Desulfobacterales bacterium]|nr:TRAP transporter substrate-binding protein [Desulfobacterales bacterium]
MISKKALLTVGFSLMLGAYSFANAADAIKLKFASGFPPMHRNTAMMEKFSKELAAKSNGKLEITHLGGGTLLSMLKMASGVQTGVADIGLSHISYSAGRFPVSEVMELPVGFPSPWVGAHAMIDFTEKFKPKEWDAYQLLMISSSPLCVPQTLKKPVRTLEDLKGLKVRAQGRIADVTAAFGATPMPLEIVDVYEALRRGVLDGNLGNFEMMKGFKFGELLKFTTASVNVSMVNVFYVVMNKNKFNSLPADMKKLIMDFSKEFNEEWARSWNEIEIEGREYFLSQGGEILPLAENESAKWVKAVEPVFDKYKKDMVSKGHKAEDVDSWVKFLKERTQSWKEQQKARKIQSAYQD